MHSILYKRENSANLRKHVGRIRNQNLTMRKKCPAVFGDFFQFVEIFAILLSNFQQFTALETVNWNERLD